MGAGSDISNWRNGDISIWRLHLAYTLGALWNRTRDRQVLDEALDAVEAALGLIKQIGVREHIPAAELARETILAAMGHRAEKAVAA